MSSSTSLSSDSTSSDELPEHHTYDQPQPYLFEPKYVSTDSNSSSDDEHSSESEGTSRLGNTDW